MIPELQLSDARLTRRREHLMTEIAKNASPVTTSSGEGRRTVRRWVAAGVVVAAATAAAFVGLIVSAGSSDLGAPAFAVTRAPNGTVTVHIVSTKASADQMTHQLQSQGVNVRIETMPASPQLVGTWVYAEFSGDVPQAEAASVVAQTQGYVSSIKIPSDLTGRIVLGVGRAPTEGEHVQVFGLRNALAPGGQLECLGLRGVATHVAASRLQQRGYTVRWTTRPGGSTTSSAPVDQRVTEAFVADGSKEVTLVTAIAGTSMYDHQVATGFGVSKQDIGSHCAS